MKLYAIGMLVGVIVAFSGAAIVFALVIKPEWRCSVPQIQNNVEVCNEYTRVYR